MTQEDAWWGLDRIDQRVLPLDGEYAYETCDEAAPATDVYIFDTGVRCSHMEFDALAPGALGGFGGRRLVLGIPGGLLRLFEGLSAVEQLLLQLGRADTPILARGRGPF